MASQIGEMVHDLVGRDFRRIAAVDARVLLVEGADRVLTSFPASLSKKAARSLHSIGVTTMLGSLVVDVTAETVSIQATDGSTQRLGARTVIWAAGVEASRLARRLGEATGAEVDHTGRVSVRPTSPSPATLRCSRSATWSRCATPTGRRSTCPAPRPSPSSKGATSPRPSATESRTALQELLTAGIDDEDVRQVSSV